MATGRITHEDLLQQGNPAADAIKGIGDLKKSLMRLPNL